MWDERPRPERDSSITTTRIIMSDNTDVLEVEAKEKPVSVWSNYGYKGSRKEAKQRGDLIDAGDAGWDAGFKWPVAIVADVYDDLVEWNESDAEKVEETDSEDRRLWNLVFAAAQVIRQIEKHTDRVTFSVTATSRNNGHVEESVELLIIGHPDDEGNPCLTIRRPIEIKS